MHVYGSSPVYRSVEQGMTASLHAQGFSLSTAAAASASRIYEMMQQQARALAYVDVVHVLVVLTACLIPIGYLMKKPRFRPKHVEIE